MNDNFKEWFSSGLKMKRWLLLVLFGTILLSYGIANIIAVETLEIMELLSVAISFILGFTFIVMGFVMAQRRLLQALAESNAGLNQRSVNIKKLLFDKKMLDRNIKIVVIGGGTGLSTVLQGIKPFSNNITAIVTTADNNTNSDIITKSYGLLPADDVRQSIIALSDKENTMETVMKYKFQDGPLKGYKFGSILLAAMNSICKDNFSLAIQNTSNILSITGKVLPATLDKVTVGAVLKDGTKVIGEKNIPESVVEKNSPIEKIFLSPSVCVPAPDVVRSVKEANVIIIGPGNLYTGIIPNLLIREISDEIRKSKATKVFVTNIMSQKGQTDNYKVSDFLSAIQEHAGKGLMQYCIASDSDIMPEYIRRYNEYGSDIIEVDKANVKGMGVTLVTEDLATVSEKDYIRHDPDKLAKVIMKIICDNMDLANNKQAFEYFAIKSRLKSMDKKSRKSKNILFRDVKIIKNKTTEVPVVGQRK